MRSPRPGDEWRQRPSDRILPKRNNRVAKIDSHHDALGRIKLQHATNINRKMTLALAVIGLKEVAAKVQYSRSDLSEHANFL